MTGLKLSAMQAQNIVIACSPCNKAGGCWPEYIVGIDITRPIRAVIFSAMVRAANAAVLFPHDMLFLMRFPVTPAADGSVHPTAMPV